MTDYLDVYARQLETALASESLTDEEREALQEALEEARTSKDTGDRPGTRPRPLSRAEFEAEWAFLLRWPLETRLGCLRILRELGVLEALEKNFPDKHAFLVELLLADRPRHQTPPADTLIALAPNQV
jgi:hypothetical protein